MKSLFTLFIACLLSATADAQEGVVALSPVEKGIEMSPAAAQRMLQGKVKNPAKAVQKKITLNDGERLMGLYTTDDLPDMEGGYIRVGDPTTIGEYPVGVLFEDEVTHKFIGGQITRFRFAVACDVEVYSAAIYTSTDGLNISSEPIAEVAINETLSTGWHEVELAEPITIEEGVNYLLCYDYREPRNIYPVASDGELDVDYFSSYGILAYGRLGSTSRSWHSYTGYGSVCVQAVVAGGNFAADDLALCNPSVNKYASMDEPLQYSVKIRNDGTAALSSYTLDIAIDGVTLETLDTPIAVAAGSSERFEGTLTLPAGTTTGNHTLTVTVTTINGAVPTEYTYDDSVEIEFIAYEGMLPERQMHLIENFTSTSCTYCYLGHNLLEAMQENYPGKYAWVALHYPMTTEDPYYFEETNDVYLFEDVEGLPSAGFDRLYFDDSSVNTYDAIAVVISYNDANYGAETINRLVDEAYADMPAFATVDIVPEYNSDTRELTITVKGEGGTVSQTELDGYRLTIYLTEDGIVGRQYTNGRWEDDYTHNNVLRAIVNDYPWGDDINWTSASTYSNTVTTTLDEEWDDSQMYITAFISAPMKVLSGVNWVDGDVHKAYVNNCNRVKITDVPAGISTVNSAVTGQEEYYTIDGRRMNSLTKGVNIVRMPSGLTKKVVVE